MASKMPILVGNFWYLLFWVPFILVMLISYGSEKGFTVWIINCVLKSIIIRHIKQTALFCSVLLGCILHEPSKQSF
jgi:hypothetical protein